MAASPLPSPSALIPNARSRRGGPQRVCLVAALDPSASPPPENNSYTNTGTHTAARAYVAAQSLLLGVHGNQSPWLLLR